MTRLSAQGKGLALDLTWARTTYEPLFLPSNMQFRHGGG